MKKLITMTIMVLAVATLMAQTPEKLTYQAMVRNAGNVLVTNTQVGVRVSILQGSASGSAVYVETLTATTNANGLMTVEIGGGNAQQGVFADINWANGPYFLKTETDPNGGSNYSVTSVQQLLSVPYALYAKAAGNGFSGDYNDLANTPVIPTVPTNVSAFTNDAGYITTQDIPTIPTVPTNVSAFTNDVPYLTAEQQILSISHDTIFLTGGSFVKLPAGFDGDYNSLVNKPTIPTVPTNVSAFVNDADYLTDYTETDPQYNAWNKDYNDLINKPVIPTVPTNVSAFENDVPYLTAYSETDPLFTAWDKDYNDLTNRPQIPVDVSAFNNDMHYITEAQLADFLASINYTIDSLRSRIEELEEGQNPPTPVIQLPTVFTSEVSDVTSTTAVAGGRVTSDGGAEVSEKGVCWGISQSPTLDGNHTTDGVDTGVFVSALTDLQPETTYYVRAYATNSVGTAYGEEISFTTAAAPVTALPCPEAPTVTDYDGNIYNTVQIGTQCWMKENLRTTHYSDGTLIESNFSTSSTTPYLYAPNNDTNNVSVYGYLYNWKAVMRNANSSTTNPSDVQGICPNGWHVPSNLEWIQLTNYVAGQNDYDCDGIAAALAAADGWNTSSGGCDIGGSPATTNATGFSALPAGYYNSYYSNNYFGQRAQFWSATDNGLETAVYEEFRYNLSLDMRSTSVKYSGKSVRCVRGTAADEIIPDTSSVNPSPCHGETTVSDYDGNIYNTVQIGEQCWIKENIRSTHYSDGTVIALGTETSATTPYRYYPDNNSDNLLAYGYLYNWSALMHGASSSHANPSGVQGVCPSGWHVPSQPEWLQLCDYMSGQNEYLCDNNSAYIGKALAGTNGWVASTSNCAIGNDLSANNASGFGALPAGRRNGTNGLYATFGTNAYFWTSTLGDANSGYTFYLYNGGIGVNRNNLYSLTYGLSVRCLKD